MRNWMSLFENKTVDEVKTVTLPLTWETIVNDYAYRNGGRQMVKRTTVRLSLGKILVGYYEMEEGYPNVKISFLGRYGGMNKHKTTSEEEAKTFLLDQLNQLL